VCGALCGISFYLLLDTLYLVV